MHHLINPFWQFQNKTKGHLKKNLTVFIATKLIKQYKVIPLITQHNIGTVEVSKMECANNDVAILIIRKDWPSTLVP